MIRAFLFAAIAVFSVNSFGDMPNLAGEYRCWVLGSPVGVLKLVPGEDAQTLNIDRSGLSPRVKLAESKFICMNSDPESLSEEFYNCTESRISNRIMSGNQSRVLSVDQNGDAQIKIRSCYTNSLTLGFTDYRVEMDCQKTH